MDHDHLRDRVYWGLNRAAMVLGRATDAYRPHTARDPLSPDNRYLRLHASFSRSDGDFNQPVIYGMSTWRGYFDGAYTKPGDYLVQGADIWFIAGQSALQPLLCVKTNRLVSINRRPQPAIASSITTTPATQIEVAVHWPVSLIGVQTKGLPSTGLPGDTAVPFVTMLIPTIPGATIRGADIVSDDQGSSYVVLASEQTDLGCRVNLREVTA